MPLTVNYDFIWDIWEKHSKELIDETPDKTFLKWMEGVDFIKAKPEVVVER